MTNSPFYAAFERMWEHIINKFDNYVKIENLDELSEALELIAVEDIDNICGAITQIITFTISGTSYQAEDGLTWAQWIVSDYCSNRLYNGTTYIYTEGGATLRDAASSIVSPSAVIIPNHAYKFVLNSGGAQ